jgi:ERCC4-type nuclease
MDKLNNRHHPTALSRSVMSKNDYRITVFADDRESKNDVIKLLSDMKNVSVVVKRLAVGDYIVDNIIVDKNLDEGLYTQYWVSLIIPSREAGGFSK